MDHDVYFGQLQILVFLSGNIMDHKVLHPPDEYECFELFRRRNNSMSFSMCGMDNGT